jgi:DnaJ-class molecular chaperone
MRDEKDHYKTLHVDPEADPDVITAAFKTLSKKLHPETDFTGIQEYHLAELTRSYKILHDPAERKAYDLRRAFRLRAMGPGGDEEEVEPQQLHLAERVYAHMNEADAGADRHLDFGRYAGQTLREIANVDVEYLRWLSRHSSGIRYRSAIIKLLNERVVAPYSAPDPR